MERSVRPGDRGPAAADCLATAWALRQSVLPRVTDTGDLLALSDAFAAALCAPAYDRLARLLSPSSSRDTAALLAFLSGLPAPRHLCRLLSRCPRLCDVLRPPTDGLRGALVAACSAPDAPLDALRALAGVRGVPGQAYESAAPGALVAACRRGGPRAAEAVRVLAGPPFNAGASASAREAPGTLAAALQAACASGCLGAVGELAGPPYGLGREHALLHDEEEMTAVDLACESGAVGVVDALARAPFDVAREDLAENEFTALRAACKMGRADVVARLALPPFALTQDDARACNALCFGAASAAVLDALAREPYSLGAGDARAENNLALRLACAAETADALRRLAQPPYSLGRDDALASECRALRVACKNGSVAVIDALALPPFALTREDARAGGGRALVAACNCGSAAAVRRLAQAPYSLGREDARIGGSAPLMCACCEGHLAVVEELVREPYSVGAAEARECRALLWACKSGNAELVRAMAREPFLFDGADAARKGNLALLCACFSGSADAVRALSEPPFGLRFAVEKPATLSAALAAIESVSHDEEVQPEVEGLITAAAANMNSNEAFAKQFAQSFGSLACAALLRPAGPRCVQQSEDNACFVLELLYRASEHWDGPPCVPDDLACDVVAWMLRAAPDADIQDVASNLLWKLSQASRELTRLIVTSGGVKALQRVLRSLSDPEAIYGASGALASLYNMDRQSIRALDQDAHKQTVDAVVRVLRSDLQGGENGSSYIGCSVDVLFRVSCYEEFVPLLSSRGALEALAKAAEARSDDVLLRSSVCLVFCSLLSHERAAPLVVAAGAVPLAMHIIDTQSEGGDGEGDGEIQLTGFRLLYYATARNRKPGAPVDREADRLHEQVRMWGFVDKVSKVAALFPKDGEVQAEIRNLVAGFDRREHARVAEARRRGVCTVMPGYCGESCNLRSDQFCSQCSMQQWAARCRTCFGMDANKDVCEVCAATCHKGHQLADWRFLPCRCDCLCPKQK
eukprot:m51a1_g9321 hypothetical protein (987) ;mRNA; r:139314-142274